jgi:hypothetical protein
MCGSSNAVILSNNIGDYYVSCGDPSDEEKGGCGLTTSERRCEDPKHAAERWSRRAGAQEGEAMRLLERFALNYYYREDWNQDMPLTHSDLLTLGDLGAAWRLFGITEENYHERRRALALKGLPDPPKEDER